MGPRICQHLLGQVASLILGIGIGKLTIAAHLSLTLNLVLINKNKGDIVIS